MLPTMKAVTWFTAATISVFAGACAVAAPCASDKVQELVDHGITKAEDIEHLLDCDLPAASVDPASGPAPARGWTPAESGIEGMRALAYQSDRMLPGEFAGLLYSGMEVEWAPFYWSGQSSFAIQLLLDVEGDGIQNFSGVALGDESGNDVISLYETSLDKYGQNSRPTEPAHLACRPGEAPSEAVQCKHICFRAFPPFSDPDFGSTAIPCSAADARWLLVVIRGQLWDENDASLDWATNAGDKVAASSRLIVKVGHGKSTNTWFPVDDAFRKAIWDVVY